MEISFSWFKSKKKKEMEDLLVEEQLLTQKLKNKKLMRELDKEDEVVLPKKGSDFDIDKKPYNSVRLVNDVLTVILHDGSILAKMNSTADDFSKVREARTEMEIAKIMGSEEYAEELKQHKKEVEKAESVYKGFELLKSVDDFIVEGNSVYLKGINRSLPPLLVEKFAEIVSVYQEKGEEFNDMVGILADDEEYVALKRFFMWCCLNPRAEVADQLYGFLQQNGMRITKQGFFVALRNVVNVAGNDSEVVEFISNAYNKIKGVWKKKPIDYVVVNKNGEYKFQKIKVRKEDDLSIDEPYEGTVIGNLQELYEDLPNMRENRFTDNWTRTFDIRIGKPVQMKPEECSWSTQDCAEAGLHFAGHTAPYVLCGDTSVFVLINPMTVVGIGSEKGRCYEYFPFMTTNVEEADEIMNSEDYDFLQMDEHYTIEQLEQLEDRVKKGFSAETTKYEFNLPHMSTKEMRDIISQLGEMKDEISSRVVPVL